ncbi:MAG: DNA-binding protein [Candidatus Marsarchaeota archaeon]|nr:DNA-binding protein [Candidatus Marsarchaeota archaeon]
MPEDDEYNKKMRSRLEAGIKRMQEDQQRRELARKILDTGAYERLMNIKSTNPELYGQILNILISIVQSQNLNGRITETQFMQLLSRITSKPEPTISFKHK